MYDSLAVKGTVADRSVIIEVGVLVQRFLHFVPLSSQFSILNLQFDLVDFKFMIEVTNIFSNAD